MINYFERKLDDKNRLTIPAEVQGEFEGGFVVITRSFRPGYLHLYSEKVWSEEMGEALKGDVLDEESFERNLKFNEGQTTSELDTKQGRISFEPHQLRYAGIGRNVRATRILLKGNKSYWVISGEGKKK